MTDLCSLVSSFARRGSSQQAYFHHDLNQRDESDLKTVSIIIPTHHSPTIYQVCQALHAQTADLTAVEVLILGDDDPAAIVSDDLIRFIHLSPEYNAAVKRNIGMSQAQGDIFLFLDSDCIPEPDWLSVHLQSHAAGHEIVGGAVTFATDNYFQLADNVSAFHDLLPFTAVGPRDYLATANLSLRREVVETVGPMPTPPRAHDLEWTVRFRQYGYTLHFEPQALVHHQPPRHNWATVYPHWANDAHDTLAVRLRYADMLHTPRLAAYRASYLWGAPLVAAWATAKTFRHPQSWCRYAHTLPLVYLTKLAWCWGAYWDFPIAELEEHT